MVCERNKEEWQSEYKSRCKLGYEYDNSEWSNALRNVNIDRPRYDQDYYYGRFRHYMSLTNPLNVFAREQSLENARCIVLKYRCRESLPESMTINELWKAKHLYDSAYHRATGEKVPLLGRMSAQVPASIFITLMMLTYYKSTGSLIFWQWFNQSYNALAHYSNRKVEHTTHNKNQLRTAYTLSTTASIITVLSLKRGLRNFPPIMARFIPLAGVCVGNAIAIPCMRAQELKDGIPIYDEYNRKLGNSKAAAQSGVRQMMVSRWLMVIPGMTLIPFVMNHLERRGTICRYPWMTIPMQLAMLGLCVTIATPMAWAIFKQYTEIPFKSLEEELKCKLYQKYNRKPPKIVYYDKGIYI